MIFENEKIRIPYLIFIFDKRVNYSNTTTLMFMITKTDEHYTVPCKRLSVKFLAKCVYKTKMSKNDL